MIKPIHSRKQLVTLGLWTLLVTFISVRGVHGFPDDGYVRIGGQVFEAGKIYGMREPKGEIPLWNQCIMVDRIHKECSVGVQQSWQRARNVLGLVVIDRKVATLYYVNLSLDGKALLIECYAKTACKIRDFY